VEWQTGTNTNALNLITVNGIPPHPIPLPSGERDGVRGPHVKEINAFVLVDKLKKRGLKFWMRLITEPG
jgi:hypothetical protein